LHTKVREYQNTHCMFNNGFLKIFPFFEIILKNIVQLDRPQMAVIWYMCFPCWITKATHSHSEYVTLLLVHDKNGKSERPQYYVFTYIDSQVFLVRVSFALYW